MLRSALVLPGLALLLCGCGDPMVRRGHAALGRGAYPEAIAAFRDAKRRLPPDPRLDAALASGHRRQLLEDVEAGRCDAAATHLQAAESLSPTVLADHHALYRCREAHGGPDDVRVAELKALVSAGDNRAPVLHALMVAHLRAGRDAEALALLAPLEKRFALSAGDRRTLAEALVRIGNEARALEQLQRVRADDPMDPILRFRIAELLEQTGAVDDAGQVYAALATDYSKNPVVFLRIAAFHRRHGRADDATAAQARADALRGLEPDTRELRPLRKSKR